MPRRPVRTRIHPLRSLVGTAAVAVFAALVYLTTLPPIQRGVERAAPPSTPEDWQHGFQERGAAITERLEHGRLAPGAPVLQPRGAGAVRWMHRGYELVLPREAKDDVRVALELARGEDSSASVSIDEDTGGMRADFGIDGLLTHTVTVHWKTAPVAPAPPRVVVVIDDLGNDLLSARQLVSLDFPVVLSVMPGRPYSREVAELASLFGREVLLHLPMEAQSGEEHGESDLLRADASQDEILKLVDESLANVPHVIGVNNHMGSRFTEDQQRMTWVLQRLKERQLFFLDSVTSAHSVARDVATSIGLPYLSRQVFLDDPVDPAVIQDRLSQLLEIARLHGVAIGIGHPHPETLAALQTLSAAATARGVTIATVSALVPKAPASVAAAGRN